MPGDGPVLELAHVAREEAAPQPLLQRLAGELSQQRLDLLRAAVAVFGAQAVPHTLGQARFAGYRSQRDDAVGVGPGRDRFAGLDLARPAVAQQAQDEHAEPVFEQAQFLRLAADAFGAQLLQQPVDADGMDLELLA